MMDVCSKLQLNNLIPTSVNNLFDVAFCVICIPKFLHEKTKVPHDKVKASQGELALVNTVFALSGGGQNRS